MRKTQWKDEQLEELLKQLPKVSDNRDPRDIYQQISIKLKRKKRIGMLIPGLASAAAIILFFVLASGLSNWNQHSSRESLNNSSTESSNDLRLEEKIENKSPGLMMKTDKNEQSALDAQEKQMEVAEGENEKYPYFLLYDESQKLPLLVPLKETAVSLAEAFLAMRSDIPAQGLKASIPETLQFEKIERDNRKLTIYIRKGTEIPQTPEMVYYLEAILVTAKGFGFETVEFKNMNSKQIGPFRLDQPIKVPEGPNKE